MLEKTFNPSEVERRLYLQWEDFGAFVCGTDEVNSICTKTYSIVIPPPNVTGSLHMGHALNTTLQDIIIRLQRMRGQDVLWQPGTDHAGIATQAVIERRLRELEGKTRHDIGREALVQRIWDWKDRYQQRIVNQQRAMGCSCDWDRQRFTMDAVCSRAVRHTFLSLFRDGLVFRGTRLVNWDCALRTAVSDDEINHRKVNGSYWHLRYPVIDPKPGDPDHVVVATTRPETMLGDTAVACHPNPEAALELAIERLAARVDSSNRRDRIELEDELAKLHQRRTTLLPGLIRLDVGIGGFIVYSTPLLADKNSRNHCNELPFQTFISVSNLFNLHMGFH